MDEFFRWMGASWHPTHSTNGAVLVLLLTLFGLGLIAGFAIGRMTQKEKHESGE